MNDDKSKSIKEQIDDGELAINFKLPDEYVKRLVFQAMIPTQKKYMKAAISSFCLSCEHCDYCPIKANTTKCHRFHRFTQNYLEQIKDEIL